MLRYNISLFTRAEKEKVFSLYEKEKDIDAIIRETSLFKEEILAILLHKGIPNKELNPYAINTEITEDKILLIADTHLGSQLDNIEYIQMAYDYAREHHIRTIIHLGDVFQSTMRNVDVRYIQVERQIEKALSIFPYYEEITTYFLFGNHDLHLFRKETSFLEECQRIPNLRIIGFKEAYVSWKNAIISLHHPIKKYNLAIPNLQEDLMLYGHRHELNLRGNKICLSTLSDDTKTYNTGKGIPGFLVASLNEGEIVLENIEIERKWQNRGVILRKKIDRVGENT